MGTVRAEIEIDAPAERIFDILTDLPAYAEWNPFTPRVESTLRLASDTLIWEEGGVTHRVEGAPSLADAVRVAESLE